MFCSKGLDIMHVVRTDLLCVVCIGLLSAEFSTVNTGLSRPMFWKPLWLLSTPEAYRFTVCCVLCVLGYYQLNSQL